MIEIIELVLPALLVAMISWYFFDRWITQKQDENSEMIEVERVKTVLPLKIKAFERLIIMMERSKPSALVMRVNVGMMTAGQLQLELLKAIRIEFEHNVSLQMYVSESTWRAAVSAKEELMELVKSASSKVKPEESSLVLCQEIFALEAAGASAMVYKALACLNAEIKQDLMS